MPRGVPKNGKRKPRGKTPKAEKDVKKKRLPKAEKQPRKPRVKKDPEVAVNGPEVEDVWQFEKLPKTELPPGFRRLEPDTRVRIEADPKWGIDERRGFVARHDDDSRFCYVKWNDGSSYWVAADILVIEKLSNKDQSKFYKQYEGMDESVKGSAAADGQKTRRLPKSDSAGNTGSNVESGKARKRVDKLSEGTETDRQKLAKELAVERVTSKTPRIRLYASA